MVERTRCKKKRTSKRRKEEKLKNAEKEEVKTQNFFYVCEKTQMRNKNKATKLAIETEEKTFS